MYFTGKLSGLQLYQKETSTQVFSCEICKNFKNTYFVEHLWTTASVYLMVVSMLWKKDGINDIILPITGVVIKKITLSPENESLSNSHKILQDGVRKHMANLKILYIRSHPSFDNAWIKLTCPAKTLIDQIMLLMLTPEIANLKQLL